MSLQIRLFGQLEVMDASSASPITLRSRARRLLVYLLLHRALRLSRHETAYRLWPDAPETTALSTLRRALSELRAGLPAPAQGSYVTVSRTHVQWRQDIAQWLDLDRYEQLVQAGTADSLQEAVALYRDALLTDFDEVWVAGERERLRRRQLDVYLQLAQHQRTVGRWAEAARLAQLALQLDPYAEAGYRELMRVHFEVGDRARALAEYERLRALLHEELGVAPLAETVALREAIARGTAVWSEPPVLTAAPESPPPTPLFGRDSERATLQKLWQDSADGRGQIAFVSGEAGTGKSHLAQDLAQWVTAAGGQVLTGDCYEFENVLPYQPIAGMLRAARPALAQLSVPQGHRAALGRLLPDFADAVANVAASAASEAELADDVGERRTQLFEALLYVFVALARHRPVLLLLEDVHWAGDSTLDWLTYSLSMLQQERLLVVITYRTYEVDDRHALARLERRLTRRNRAVRLRLAPLEPSAHRQLVTYLSQLEGPAAAALADRLYKQTGGNPFFLRELLEGLLETDQIVRTNEGWTGPFIKAPDTTLPLPDSLRALIDARVARLNERARLFVRTAAVAGRVFDHQIARESGGWSEEQSLAALDELLARGLLKSVPGMPTFAFSHHLVQEVLYGGLAPSRRTYLHRQMLKATRKLRPDDVEALMHHAIGAGDTKQAVDYGLQAARRADHFYAYEEAVRYREQVLALTASGPAGQRLTVTEALADGYRLLRRGAQAVKVYGDCVEMASQLKELDRSTIVRLYRKIIQVTAGMRGSAKASDLSIAYDIREKLLPDIQHQLGWLQSQPPRADTVFLLTALAGDALVSRPEVAWEEALSFTQDAVTVAERLRDPHPLISALTTQGSVFGAGGLVRERVHVAEHLLALVRKHQSEPRTHGYALNSVGSALLHAGEYLQAIEVLKDAEKFAHERRIVDLEGRALSLLMYAFYRLDRWADMDIVEARRDKLLEQYSLERLGSPCFSIGLSGALRALRGDYELARQLRLESKRIMEQRGHPQSESWLPSGANWLRSYHY